MTEEKIEQQEEKPAETEKEVVETSKENKKEEIKTPKKVKKEIAEKINEVVQTKKKELTPKLEREYIIPLREKYRHVPRYKKTPKAIKTIKEFLVRHMKIRDRDLNKIKIDKYLNEAVWTRGIKKPPMKIKVKAIKEGDIVRVELVDYSDKLKFKKLRHEKRDKKTLDSMESKKTLKEKVQEQMKGKKKETEDKNKDGVDDKVELEEKKKAVKEQGEKIEKEMAKKEKHTTKNKSMKEKLGAKNQEDQRSQGK